MSPCLYRLVRAGGFFVASMQGKGSIVLSKENEFLREQYLMRIEEGIQLAVETAKRINMTEDVRKHLIGITQHEFGFAALIKSDDAAYLPQGCVTDRPSIDRIMLHLLRQRKTTN